MNGSRTTSGYFTEVPSTSVQYSVKTTVLASELTLEKFSNRFRGADLPIEGVGVGTSFLGFI